MKIKSEWISKKDGTKKQEFGFTADDKGVIISQTPYEDNRGKFTKYKLRVKLDGDSEAERWITLSDGQLKECRKFSDLSNRIFKMENSKPFDIKLETGTKTVTALNINIQRTKEEWDALKSNKTKGKSETIAPSLPSTASIQGSAKHGLFSSKATIDFKPWVKNQDVEKVINHMVENKEVFLTEYIHTEFKNGAESPYVFIRAAKDTPEIAGLTDQQLIAVWNEIKARILITG